MAIFLFLLPFLCAESSWVARNYMKHNRIFFTVQSVNYPWADMCFDSLGNFVASWGGNAYYEPNAEIFWFEYHQDIFHVPDSKIKEIKFPDYIYTTKFNLDSLHSLKKMLQLSKDSALTEVQRNAYQLKGTELLKSYSKSIQEEHPILYYLFVPIKLTGRFIFQSGSHFWFFKPFYALNLLEKIIKIFYSIFYWMVAVAGIMGSIFLLRKQLLQFNLKVLVSLIPLYFIIVHPVFLRFTEERFIIPAYPFLTILTVYVFQVLYKKWFKVNPK
jgi:hypothetical protein